MFLKFARHALAVTLVFSSVIAVSSPSRAEVWTPSPLPAESNQLSVTLDDGWRFYGAVSSVNNRGKYCEDWTGGCEPDAKADLVANLILPVCSSAAEVFCLEGLELGSAGQETRPARVLRELKGYNVPQNNRLGFPRGALPTLFESEVVNASGSNEYMVSARVLVGYENNKPKLIDFQTSVWAVQGKTDPTKSAVNFRPTDATRPASVEGGWDAQCAGVEQAYCAQIVDFAPETRVKVSLRISSQITGWLKGRLTNPEVNSRTLSNGSVRYEISGEPVAVPIFGGNLPKSHPFFKSPDGMTTIGSPGGIYNTLRADSPTGVELVSKFAEAVDDTAAATRTQWYISTISTNAGNLQQCTERAGEFVGLVTTNAMAFDGGVPEFEAGVLKYNIAGLHYLPDGKTEALGTYDLAIKSDVARCLYGYGNAPISATISVVGDGEEQKVAVTQVRERDGWLTLSAKGFTYSQNEIRAVVTQPQMRTLSDHPGRATALTSKQRAEIRAVLAKGKANTKFICTGIRLEGQSESMNRTVRLRAKLACDYAKSLDPKLSTFFQTKTTKARSFNGRVMVVSK